jgi:flagellar protein FliS
MALSYSFDQYHKTQVNTADQVRLILMMYDGAIQFIQQAEMKLEKNDVLGKSQDVAKAQRIVSELQNALNLKKGGQIAVSLDAIYVYVNNQLSMANLKNSRDHLENAIAVLKELREGWQAISLTQEASTGAQEPIFNKEIAQSSP